MYAGESVRFEVIWIDEKPFTIVYVNDIEEAIGTVYKYDNRRMAVSAGRIIKCSVDAKEYAISIGSKDREWFEGFCAGSNDVVHLRDDGLMEYGEICSNGRSIAVCINKRCVMLTPRGVEGRVDLKEECLEKAVGGIIAFK